MKAVWIICSPGPTAASEFDTNKPTPLPLLFGINETKLSKILHTEHPTLSAFWFSFVIVEQPVVRFIYRSLYTGHEDLDTDRQ
jgi:hypothetical protein